MKLLGRSSEPTRKITINRRTFVGALFGVALIAQIVAIYAQANAAQAQGSFIEPAQEVSDFLVALLFFTAAGIVLVATLWVVFYVMRIPAGGDSGPQRFVARVCCVAGGLVIAGLVVFFTNDYWQDPERRAMLAVPLFYVVLGGVLRLVFGRVRKAVPSSGDSGNSPASPRSSESRRTSTPRYGSDTDTGPVPADVAAH